MSRRALVTVLIAGAVIAVLALVFRWSQSPPGREGGVEPSALSTPAARSESTPIAVPAADSHERSVAAEIPPATPTAAPEEPATIEAPIEHPDLDAKFPLEILVVDEQQQPVFDAQVRLDGMRSESSPGAWYSFRGEPAQARTDPRGRARLDVWRWVDIDGRTIEVDVSVSHPDFVPFRDDSFAVGPGEHVIELRRGAVVSVRAWHGSPSKIVEDVRISLEREAALGPDAWTRESDGRLVTTRIAPGRHLVRVEHLPLTSRSGPLYSAVEPFEVRANERVDLSIELVESRTLSGRLADSVPRPVLDGRVRLTLVESFPGPNNGGCLASQHEAAVQPDGSFTIFDLPPGNGFVFALCRGFVSSRVRPTNLAEAGIMLTAGATAEDEARALSNLGENAGLPQRIVVPAPGPVTIEMVATGSLEITVTRADGEPIANARASAWANVHVPQYGSTLVPWREWSHATDLTGSARFDDVPPEDSLWLEAEAEGFQMTAADRADSPSVVIRSGEVARRSIVLEPIDSQPR